VAEDILITGHAKVAIIDTHWYVRLHHLTMEGPSLLGFQNDKDRFFVVLTEAINISSDSTWDFTHNQRV